MSLPDIPDAAVGAIVLARISTEYGIVDPWTARDVLAPAWPHLYAAALRHAAETASIGGTEGMNPAYRVLHRMADEATS